MEQLSCVLYQTIQFKIAKRFWGLDSKAIRFKTRRISNLKQKDKFIDEFLIKPVLDVNNAKFVFVFVNKERIIIAK